MRTDFIGTLFALSLALTALYYATAPEPLGVTPAAYDKPNAILEEMTPLQSKAGF